MDERIASMSPAELLGEWKTLEMDLSTLDDGDTDLRDVRERVGVVSRALDEKCEAAGIFNVQGFVKFREVHSGIPCSGDGNNSGPMSVAYLKDLLEWLLIRPKTT